MYAQIKQHGNKLSALLVMLLAAFFIATPQVNAQSTTIISLEIVTIIFTPTTFNVTTTIQLLSATATSTLSVTATPIIDTLISISLETLLDPNLTATGTGIVTSSRTFTFFSTAAVFTATETVTNFQTQFNTSALSTATVTRSLIRTGSFTDPFYTTAFFSTFTQLDPFVTVVFPQIITVSTTVPSTAVIFSTNNNFVSVSVATVSTVSINRTVSIPSSITSSNLFTFCLNLSTTTVATLSTFTVISGLVTSTYHSTTFSLSPIYHRTKTLNICRHKDPSCGCRGEKSKSKSRSRSHSRHSRSKSSKKSCSRSHGSRSSKKSCSRNHGSRSSSHSIEPRDKKSNSYKEISRDKSSEKRNWENNRWDSPKKQEMGGMEEKVNWVKKEKKVRIAKPKKCPIKNDKDHCYRPQMDGKCEKKPHCLKTVDGVLWINDCPVPFCDAREVCKKAGLVLAEVSQKNFQSAQRNVKRYAKGRAAWIASWNGDNYRGLPLYYQSNDIVQADNGPAYVLCQLH